MKKNDIFLCAAVLGLAIVCFVLYRFYPREQGRLLKIAEDGVVVKTLPLNRDTIYTIQSGDSVNVLQIKDGYASIIEANCKDKLCVHQQKISKQGETLICLPHKIVISIEDSGGQENSDNFDGIVK